MELEAIGGVRPQPPAITADWSILSVPSESTSVNDRRSLDFLLPLFST